MKNKIIFAILLILVIIPTFSFARYYERIMDIKLNGTIAEPIFKVEKHNETITQVIDKKTNIEEYIFTVKNYEIDENKGNKRISQVDLEYVIEIINEKDHFPISYKLYEINSQKELIINQNKTEKINISSNLEYEKTYKLVVFWNENNEKIDENTSIKICINANQTM